MTAFPTGNPMRDGAIVAVLRDLLADGEPSYSAAATLCNRYGPTFDGLSRAEYDEALATMQRVEAVAENELPSKSLENFEPPHANEDAQPHHETVEATPRPNLDGMTQEECRVALNEAQNALHLDRQSLQRAMVEQKRTADALATRILEWQTGGEKLDHTANVKAWIAGNQAHKQGVRDGSILPPHRNQRALRSAVDRQAAYSHGGDAADFVRGRMQNRGSHRGAYPSSMRGHRVAPPSER